VPLWTPANSTTPPARSDAVVPWRKLLTVAVAVVLAIGAYKTYPRAHAWWVARAVPADLHAYVEGKGVHYAPARQGFSLRLPKPPVHGDEQLGPEPGPWSAIHRAVVAGSDYRIVIRVGDLRGGAALPFGIGGALADERIGGKPAPHGLQLVSFDDRPAYAFHIDGSHPLVGRAFERGARVYVFTVESHGADRVLDALLSSFTPAGG